MRCSLFFAWFDFRVTYVPSGWNQCVDALSHKPEFTPKEDKIPPRTVILLERFVATKEPVDLRARIHEAQQQDLFVEACCHELAGDGGMQPHGCIRRTCYTFVTTSTFLGDPSMALSYINAMTARWRDISGSLRHCT